MADGDVLPQRSAYRRMAIIAAAGGGLCLLALGLATVAVPVHVQPANGTLTCGGVLETYSNGEGLAHICNASRTSRLEVVGVLAVVIVLIGGLTSITAWTASRRPGSQAAAAVDAVRKAAATTTGAIVIGLLLGAVLMAVALGVMVWFIHSNG